ncbi:MAG: DUF4358 domain-containing protein [Clostridia bacterium]|nr:DUF4358 domain-containing protein [Clostridia bacterium]
MKKLVSLFASCALVLVALSGCGERATRKISMYDLSRAMLDAGDFKQMSYASSSDQEPQDLFANVSDLDYGKVESFFISYASDGNGNADEIVVIRVNSTKNLQEAVLSLKKHLETRKSLYATYDPTQSEKLSNGIVFSQEDFAVLIVSDGNDQVHAAFNAFLKEH